MYRKVYKLNANYPFQSHLKVDLNIVARATWLNPITQLHNYRLQSEGLLMESLWDQTAGMSSSTKLLVNFRLSSLLITILNISYESSRRYSLTT